MNSLQKLWGSLTPSYGVQSQIIQPIPDLTEKSNLNFKKIFKNSRNSTWLPRILITQKCFDSKFSQLSRSIKELEGLLFTKRLITMQNLHLHRSQLVPRKLVGNLIEPETFHVKVSCKFFKQQLKIFTGFSSNLQNLLLGWQSVQSVPIEWFICKWITCDSAVTQSLNSKVCKQGATFRTNSSYR